MSPMLDDFLLSDSLKNRHFAQSRKLPPGKVPLPAKRRRKRERFCLIVSSTLAKKTNCDESRQKEFFDFPYQMC